MTVPRPCGMCGKPGRLYLPGTRCPTHAPAALHGRPEAWPDPARTLAGMRAAHGKPAALGTPAAETIIDARAKASGKRRSSLADQRIARDAVTHAEPAPARRFPDSDAATCIRCSKPAAPILADLYGRIEHPVCYPSDLLPARLPATRKAA